ncbi:diphthamide biosynthesis enzyme Dph2 [Methanopyrus sp. KOL6]|uniref:diphthamide biosynthesis enzyme Dph2 n=1 Tax=Methanopyrus sp. KOL6 TaxID=1937004 RepID=UPI0012F956BD|nr:diphthamide biosynthesis enzyme Dph2 [Methanopyrus sp. KOL6]
MTRCTSAESYDEDEVPRAVESLNVEGRVLVQAPDGLKRIAREVADVLEARGCEVELDAGRVFGACDITPGTVIRTDYIVHIGHYPIPEVERRIRELGATAHFLPVRGRKRVEPWMVEEVAEVLRNLGIERVNICATAQYVTDLELVSEILQESGIEPVIRSGDGRRVATPGLVLGCNFSALDTSLPTVVVCSGSFHPAGVAIRTSHPVVQLDPTKGVLDPEDVEGVTKRILAVRLSKIREFDWEEGFEIVESTALGQRRPGVVQILNRPIWRLRYLTEDALRSLRRRQCVFCGCPRVPVDEASRFRRWVLLNPAELAAVRAGWREYRLDEIPTPEDVLNVLRR